MKRSFALPLACFATLSGCAFEEGLPEIEVVGTVVVPKEAATRTVLDTDGNESEVTDVRFIGPVYLGAFPSIVTGDFDYTHPEMGPVIDPEFPGNTYPFGGTTIGRFDFACFEATACMVTTGRYDSFASIIDYFNTYVGTPLVDPYGDEVTSEKYFEQYCFDYYNVTSWQELSFLAVDADGNTDLDFTENADGDFVADFDMPATLYTEGMAIWGWIDSPSDAYSFSTCDTSRDGAQTNEYNLEFDAGGGHQMVLNYPSVYIFEGDYVSTEGYIMTSEDDEPVVNLDYMYTGAK